MHLFSNGHDRDDLPPKGHADRPAKGSSILRNLPWDGIIYLGASGTGILLTVLLSSNYERTAINDLYLVTFYVAFAPHGILDIIAYFKKGLKCEKLLKTFSLGTALCVHAALFIMQARHGRIADVLQMSAIIVSVFSAFGTFFVRHAAVVLGMSLMVQGTWLLQMVGELEEGSEWAQIYFAWHLLVISLIFTTILLFKERREILKVQTDQEKFASLKSKTSNTTTTTTAPHVDTSMGKLDESFLRKQMPVYSNTTIPSGLVVLPDKVSTVNECQLSVSSRLTDDGQLRRTEIRTSFKPRHPVVVSPAPSTASTALSQQLSDDKAAVQQNTKQQLKQLQQMLHHEDEKSSKIQLEKSANLHKQNFKEEQQKSSDNILNQLDDEPNTDSEHSGSAVYENTILGQKTSMDFEPNIVESEPFDRISPIDEYNTLSRHVQSVRASIKLKESGFI